MSIQFRNEPGNESTIFLSSSHNTVRDAGFSADFPASLHANRSKCCLSVRDARFLVIFPASLHVCGLLKLMASARKQGLFLAVKGKLTALARKRGVFMAAKVADPKETPSKGCLCNMYTVTRRFSAASSASARCSQNIEAAGTPGPTEGSDRYAPNRGCQRQLTGVKIVAKKKPGGQPGEFFACFKRNKFIC